MNHKINVKIVWLNVNEKGRESPPPFNGYYYPTTLLPDRSSAWSLSIEIIQTLKKRDHWVSEGYLQFLVEHAPHHLLEELSVIEIYEGPRKVADAFIQST
ncbi:hypothetical protein [Proteus hauseri]|uniref:hypothetical protein n=1 Tax=Proteus hauseri TaxID=183417 RepID=UPI0032DA6F55